MDTAKLCRVGYFDRIIVDGWLAPLYNARGVIVHGGSETFRDDLQYLGWRVKHTVANLQVRVMGESDNEETPDEVEKMRYHRENELKLVRIPYGNKDRYIIAKASVLILKAYEGEPLTSKNDICDDIAKSFCKENTVNMLQKAADIQDVIAYKHKNKEVPNVAVVEEVFVNREFRRCGISTWLHTNLRDVSLIFGVCDIGIALLIPGDFTRTCKKYGMTSDEYNDMLVDSYESVGYKKLNKKERHGIMCKYFGEHKRSLFK